MDEFNLIDKFFKVPNPNKLDKQNNVLFGIGDDTALVQPQSKQSLVITVDSMVENVHFSSFTPVSAIAHKLVVANVSDIASSGSKPKWATLSLTLDEINEKWLNEFASTLLEQLRFYGISLVGGDTTRGAVKHLSLTVIGEVTHTQYVSRKGAKVGDIICVSGTLGDSALGCLVEQKIVKLKNIEPELKINALLKKFHYPTARISLGQFLKEHVHAMIDVSDGLLQDLSHILNTSNTHYSPPLTLGAALCSKSIPLSKQFVNNFKKICNNNELKDIFNVNVNDILTFALTSGEEYELCFTLSEDQWNKGFNALRQQKVPISAIGRVTNTPEIYLDQVNLSKILNNHTGGYRHF